MNKFIHLFITTMGSFRIESFKISLNFFKAALVKTPSYLLLKKINFDYKNKVWDFWT